MDVLEDLGRMMGIAKPVGITTDGTGLIVVCDTGAVWVMVPDATDADSRHWTAGPPIPGTPAERNAAAKTDA